MRGTPATGRRRRHRRDPLRSTCVSVPGVRSVRVTLAVAALVAAGCASSGSGSGPIYAKNCAVIDNYVHPEPARCEWVRVDRGRTDLGEPVPVLPGVSLPGR
jgi:hypothetical protein